MMDFVFTRIGILIFAIEITATLFIAGLLISDFTEKEMTSREAENIVLILNKIQSLKHDIEIVYPIDISGEITINNTGKYIEIKKNDISLKKIFSANVSDTKIPLKDRIKIKKEKNFIEVT